MPILTALIRSRARATLALAVACLLAGIATFMAGSPTAATPTAKAASGSDVARVAPTPPSTDEWTSLNPTSQAILRPLQSRWALLTPTFRSQWLKVADDLRGRPPIEVRRAQSHMREWAGLSRVQRAQARRRFKSESRIAADERRRRWAAYSRRHRAAGTMPSASGPASVAAPPVQGVGATDTQESASGVSSEAARTSVRHTIVPSTNLNKGGSS